MLHSATLLGSSSGRNAGDAALISGLMESIDATCQTSLNYEIPTIKPSYIQQHYPHHQTRAISMLPWNLSIKMLGLPTFRSVMRTNLTLIFDAILFDRSLYNPLFNFISTLYLLLPYAKKRGKKMGFYNVGTGPVNTAHGRKILRELAELMDFITVRDKDSLHILQEIGVKNPRIFLGADAALNVQPPPKDKIIELFKKIDLDPDQDILGINLNRYIDTWAGPHIQPMGKETFIRTTTAALNRVAQEIEVPLLFVATQHHDVAITKAVMHALDSSVNATLLTNIDFNHYDIKGALGAISVLFGMRLHSLILASSEHTPILGLAYQPKVRHYLNSLELKTCCMDFEDFSKETLVRRILETWENRSSIKTHLQQHVPILQKRAQKAAALVGAIDRDENLDDVFSTLSEP